MVKNIDLKIQMILESRVSLEDASVIFSIPKEELVTMASKYRSPLATNLQEALQYLFYYEATYYKERDRKKTRFMAKTWLRSYLNLCRIKDKREQSQALTDFKKSFIDEKVKNFPNREKKILTSEEKEDLLRYQLKYALNNSFIIEVFHVGRHSYLEWIENNISGSLKRRYGLLNEYWTTFREKKFVDNNGRGRS